MDLFEQKCLAEQELGLALERLRENADFRLAIEKAFFQDEALHCLRASTDPVYTREVQEDFLARAKATSALDSWIGNSIRIGRDAPKQLAAHKENLASAARLRAEVEYD